jgi:hypothetical protein
MRTAFVLVLSLTVGLAGAPAALAQGGQNTGGVQGIAQNAQKQAMPQVSVQVRGADGQLAATGTTNAQGAFAFTGLPPGTYTVEILNAAGNIVGTASVTVAAGAVATVTLTAAAAGAIAGAGAGGLSLFGLGTLGTVAVIGGAAAAPVATVVATRAEQIVICLKPAGQPAQTITISEKAWPAHQAQGATLGACPASPSR